MNQDEINVFEEAKKLSLVNFLESQLKETGRKISQGIRFKTCPNCGTSKAQFRVNVLHDLKWHCHSCGEGGSIIDAAVFIWGTTPLEAAKSLLGLSDEVHVAKVKERDPTQVQSSEEAKRASEYKAAFFKKLREKLRGHIDAKVMSYLTDQRFIPRELVLKAMERGMLGMLPSDPKKAFEIIKSVASREELEIAEIWKKDSKMPGISFRPLIFFLPGAYSAEFKLIEPPKFEDQSKSVRYNQSPRPFFWRGESSEDNRTLILEGFIDLLSAIVLGWKGNIICLPGTQSYKPHGLEWFFECKRIYETELFIIGFDNDEGREDGKNPGQIAALELLEAMNEAGLPCINRPPSANDINAFLQQQKKLRLVA